MRIARSGPSLGLHEPAANRGAVSPRGFDLPARRVGLLMCEQFNLGLVLSMSAAGTPMSIGGRRQDIWSTASVNPAAGLQVFPKRLDLTMMVVICEFGRTFRENGDRGTDHGHGSVYWVLGARSLACSDLMASQAYADS